MGAKIERQLAFAGMPEPERCGAPGAGAPLRKWKPDLRQVHVSDLPESLREISRLIGLPATLALAEWRGGSEVSIPHRLPDRHPLREKLGHRPAELLAEYFAGKITLPLWASVTAPLRDRTIRAEYDGGTPLADLVWRFDRHERTLRRLLNEPEAPPPARREGTQ